MTLKRTTHVNWGTPAQNAKKLKKLEHTVYRRNIGEIKVLTGSLSSTQITNGAAYVQVLTGIATGANQGQRVGNQIRVRSIVVQGDTTSGDVDVYILQSRNGNAPTLANFTPTMGGILTQGTSQQHFRVLKQRIMPGNSGKFRLSYRYSIPMKTSYTGPTATELSLNQIYIVAINRTGANENIQFSSEITYID